MSALTGIWTALAISTLTGSSAVGGADGEVTALQVLPSADRTEVVIAVEGSVEVRDFTMEGPDRIVIDLLGARSALSGEDYQEVQRGGIQRVRASQYAEDIVRLVLEVEVAAGYTLLSADGYVRVSLENPGGAFEPWEALRSGGTVGPPDRAPAATPPSSESTEAAVSVRVPRWTGIAASDLAERITVSFTDTPMRDVLFTFADFSSRSIVPGSQVSGIVNAEIRDQPWDIALQAILESHGLAAQEAASGIIRVDRLEDLTAREDVEQLTTRPFRVNYANASELQSSVESLLSDRGRISVSGSTNSLVVTDIPRVLDAVEELVEGLDLQTPEITISARIIFVNRTDLAELGVTYDLKDSRGNQLNTLTPGQTGDAGAGTDETVPVGTNVVSLGGNSIAALGNANSRVVSPSLQFLTSLVLGRHTLISFVEALESRSLSEVQAAPQVRVLDNQQARILVGERTPIRVIDAAGGGPGLQDGAFPQATVQIEETGILLEVTPHVTAGDLILMELRAERSGLEIREADLGFVFNTQEAVTRVLVEDGETVVIGGLTVTERDEFRIGMPLLMELPLLGRFFRHSRTDTIQRDLMILVTPQINRR